MEVEQQTETRGQPDRAQHAAKDAKTPRERRNGEGAASALASLKLERARAEAKPLPEDRPSV